MQRVYSAAHSEGGFIHYAHLVRGLLAAGRSRRPASRDTCTSLYVAGIEARVLNEYATGGLGDLPADAVRPEVWIENARDLPRARQIVDAYEQAPASQGLIGCPACGEDSPRGFGLCWKCLRPLPD